MRTVASYRQRAWRKGAPKRERTRARRALKLVLAVRTRRLIGAVASGAWYVADDATVVRRAPDSVTDAEAYGRALLTRERLVETQRAVKRRMEELAPPVLRAVGLPRSKKTRKVLLKRGRKKA